IWLDNDILTYPTASSKIDSKTCEITRSGGGLPESEAKQTAALIRGGSLPLSLKEVESSVQTASIGANALDKSIVAGGIGLLLVFALMILSFNLLGVFADIALTLYVLMVLWIMAAMGAVLTLPGIAGIILGIGMAVDANVIIFSRIREEIGLGRSVRMAVDIGFKHALVTVLDSQITTLIATVVLYELGSTTVKGFALTLMISIIISIITAVFVTQVFVSLLAGMRNPNMAFFGCKADGTPKTLIKRDFHFIEKRKIFYIISAAVILFGLVNLGIRGFNYGIDFTGGTMIQMDMGKKVSVQKVEDEVSKYNLKDLSVVYSGSGQKEVILRTTDALNANQRENVQKTLEKAFDRTERDVISSQEFGPTVGIQLRSNAIKAILIAALGMLVYIIFRFKSWKYGVAAVAGLGHDVLVLIGVYAVFGITVNNPFIAAVLTIVGYSINDTIVIFDRVRENCKVMRGVPLIEILDHSISQTMNRSILTSLTTVIAIVPLLVMVSSSLAAFVLPLMVGVICGTYSSIALCSPLYYELNKREEASKYQQREKARARIEAKKKKNAAVAAEADASSHTAGTETAGESKEGEAVKDEKKVTNKPKKKSSSSKNRKSSKKRR
ncbi:MAG: protein translocase subunit SecF, partial [Eubacteriales bacterium]|nr:protein translocase subunit SecF [Eubacteriales bacterium]